MGAGQLREFLLARAATQRLAAVGVVKFQDLTAMEG